MDKKSNRTDLLAAGRKKLQQYRKKKDSKGKDGKGASQSQHKDADLNVVDNLNAESSQHSESRPSHQDAVEVLAHSAGSSADLPVLDGHIDHPRSELVVPEISSHGPTAEGDGQTDKHQVEIGSSTVAAEAERLQEADQVSNEADSYGPTYHDLKDNLELLTVSERGFDVSSVGISDSEINHNILEDSVPVETIGVPAEAFTDNPSNVNHLGFDVMAGLSNERVPDQQANLEDENQTDSDRKGSIECENARQPEACTDIEVEHPESMSKPIVVDSADEKYISSGRERQSFDLVQLAEVLRKLPEGDFRYLIQSRKTADHVNLDVSQTVTADIPQTLQEQLYLSNVSKDFFHLQLLEQHKQQLGSDHKHRLVFDETSVLSTSLVNLEQNNKILAAELSQCRSELEAAVSEKMEFQDLYHSAKEEAMGFSATVHELRIKLDEVMSRLSIVSADSDHGNTQLAALHQEVEELKGNLASATDERIKFEEENLILFQEKQVLSRDLVDYRLQLTALQQENSDVNRNLAAMNEEHIKQKDHEDFLIQEIERLSAELVYFQDKLSVQHQENLVLVQDKEVLSDDLVDCRHQLMPLQHENNDLSRSLPAMNGEHKKQIDHDESVIEEIERLSVELVVFQDNFLIQHQKNGQLEVYLGEALSQIEQLAEENIILQSSLEIYKAKISEADGRHIHISSAGMGSVAHTKLADGCSSEQISAKDDAKTVIPSIIRDPKDVCDSIEVNELTPGFHDGTRVVVMKGCLEEAENLMHKLENATDEMHSHSVTLSRSISRNATPGVSKLIQAFESKVNVENPDPEINPSTDNLVPSDPYLVAKGQISHLRCVLKTLAQHVELADAFFLDEKIRCNAADVSRRELEVEIESLKGICNNLEVRNIELEVLCGAMNQHAHDSEANKIHLENLLDALNREYGAQKLQNVELHDKLATSSSRISEMQVLLKEIRSSSDGVVSTVYDEIETLQREMKQNIYSVERVWKSTLSQIHPAVEKLDALTGSADKYPPPSESNDSAILDHLLFSLCAACEVIEKLTSKVEAYETLSSLYTQVTEKLHCVDEERRLALDLLKKVSADLVKLLDNSPEHVNDSGFLPLNSNQHDPFEADYYEVVVSKVGSLVGDLHELKESNKKLYSDLLNRTSEIEELNKYCLDSDAVLKLVLDVKEVLKLQNTNMDLDNTPFVLLQSSVLLLTQKFKEAEERVCSLTEECSSRVIELAKMQDNIEQLNTLNLENQNEMLILKESLSQAKNASDVIHTELLEKNKELEQSEQRVASVREKLSIAVAKGKGLVVQRDGLKHSLAEMSNELERCSQELLLKDSRILEIEEKLKAYSEAGERMEALESELTYIRNSATALRESFLMKDSALQKIEEIMEDLDLPDHFHSKDIVEKVDWLAKSAAGNSFMHADWDQISSVGGGSYSDAGLVATDGAKEDVQPTLNPVDDLRRQYDELQTKFYELAEQNDMLEQSLMERNVLVQRWEEILDRINTPPQIRSMEPEERIHWLGTALSEADHHMRSLQQKIEKLEDYCESLSGDLDESQRRISEQEMSLNAIVQEKDTALSVADEAMKSCQQKIFSLENYSGSLSSQLEDSEKRISEFESSLQEVLHDKEILSSNLVALTSDHELALHTVTQYEHDLDRLRKDIEMLQRSQIEKLKNDNYIQQVESELRRLQGMILEVLQDSLTEDGSSNVSDVEYLEKLIRKLMTHDRGVVTVSHASKEAVQDCVSEHNVNAVTVREVENADVPINTVANMDESTLRNTVLEGQDVADLRTELAEALDEVARVREEKDEFFKKFQSMAIKLETLDNNKDELQELLNQEEQKSASLREKLNLAVRKGKSLVQQRDGLKQNIEQATNEIDRLKSEIILRDNSLLECGQKISDLSLQIETCKAFEAENISLKNRLLEAEQYLQQNGHTLSMLVNKLGEFDTGVEVDAHDPLLKLEGIGKMCSELHATTASFEQEARKSKRAAELLLAELNEVQERNDGLQEELARTHNEISILSRERDLADSAKVEALSHLTKFSDEQKLHLTEMKRLKFSISEVRKVLFDVSNVADDAFAKSLELLNDVNARVESCLERVGAQLVATKDYGGLVSANKRFKDFWSRNSMLSNEVQDEVDDSIGFKISKAAEQHLKQLTEAIGEFKDRVHSRSMSLRTEVDQFIDAVTTMLGVVDSQRNSLELVKSQKIHLESIMNERDMEGAVLRKSLSLLYEACCRSITEIKNRKAQLNGQSLASADLSVNLPSLTSFEGGFFDGSSLSSSEECIKALTEILIEAVKDFVHIESEDRESRTKEMRSIVLDLQKELQEKDIQRERICMELVGQIKEAESTAANYFRDLRSAHEYAHELESKTETMGKEQTLLEQRIIELQQEHVSSIELGKKVKAMTTIVAAKEQEIETLMQALDEEENQMEALKSKVEELESTLQQKNSELEHVEAYRAKAAKKLSITVSKFDELHRMSEGLLLEIEGLQSQLQDRDSEISFLRQEVTRCTNDALEASKMSKEESYADLHEFLAWLDITLSHVLMRDAHDGDDISKNYAQCKENLQKDITSIISELEDSRIAAQNKDALLQAERNKVDELSRRKVALELSLNEKDLHLNSLQGAGISGLGTSEIVELEPMANKWTAPVASSTSQVRNWRKANSDQVTIAIDTDAGTSGRFEDEDDDKVHGFKSLTMSRFVPKFTRPVSDMMDGLWVSCDRALMRQPAFRLGIMFYWVLLHAMLASIMI
ncbi:uncharacterized protein LOC141623914 isoform X2 [Silene latifolia]|uniref:uncharacterized protein LOC141623914 isoform X2 n=1 Tax=Silene latifolia TaxID=37657 RepID=UPI003D78447B